MSREITEKPASFCPVNCRHMDLSLETEHAYSQNEVVFTTNILSCAHEKACEMWAANPDKTEELFKTGIKSILDAQR
jgi:hypothetical protein